MNCIGIDLLLPCSRDSNARVSDTKLDDSADQPLEWESIAKNIVVTAP